jgi:hypothetical protein
MGSDAIGEVIRRLAWMLIGAAAMDAAEEGVTGLGRRFPRALRLAQVVGGGLLVLIGFLQAVLSLVALAVVAYGGEGVESLILLIPSALGVLTVVWGLELVHPGWARRLSARARSAQRSSSIQ